MMMKMMMPVRLLPPGSDQLLLLSRKFRPPEEASCGLLFLDRRVFPADLQGAEGHLVWGASPSGP